MYLELDSLLASTKRRMFLVDDHFRYAKVVNYIGSRLPGTAILVTAVRTNVDESGYGKMLDNMGGVFLEIDLNVLTDDELISWDHILERWGLWEDKIELTSAERFRFLKDHCGTENRAIVLAQFRSSRLSDKIITWLISL